MADKAKKSGWGQMMMDRITWAYKNPRGGSLGRTLGPAMAMMGVPWQQRSPGGSWMTIDPVRQSIYPTGMVLPPANNAATPPAGSEDPPADPNAPPPLPGDKFTKNMIPDWWEDWYRTSGQYGGVPPVQGLL